jgi:hypothetical protein
MRSKNATSFARIGAACLVLAAVSAMPAGADDNVGSRRRFTNRTIAGTWGYTQFGPVIVVPPVHPLAPTASVPASSVGVITFHGDGTCSSTRVMNLNGIPIGPVPSSRCEYAVNPDGTGSGFIEVLLQGSPLTIPLSFVIVDRGREIRFIGTDQVMSAGVAKRQ